LCAHHKTLDTSSFLDLRPVGSSTTSADLHAFLHLKACHRPDLSRWGELWMMRLHYYPGFISLAPHIIIEEIGLEIGCERAATGRVLASHGQSASRGACAC
jgi:hypothetical protein